MTHATRWLPLTLILTAALTLGQPCAAQLARAPEPANQLGVELGVLSAHLNYAHRIGDSPVLLGAGVWGAWEPVNSFDRNVFEPIAVTAFARYEPKPWLHLDAGPVLARYHYADDCSDCGGTFLGLRGGMFFGSRSLYVGPEVSLGSADDDLNGRETGLIADLRAGVRLRWR